MLILSLAGKIGAGKDEVGNYLVARYGFVKFAFSDALYREVQEAYGLEDQTLLRDRATKDTPQEQLALRHCSDESFTNLIGTLLMKRMFDAGELEPAIVPDPWFKPLSPRGVLQWWGTEYRRAQDVNYWLDRARDFVLGSHGARYPEHRPQFFVECGTRFANEQDWVHAYSGNVWHILRPDNPFAVNDGTHVSNQELQVLEGERVLVNGDSVERLHYGVDLLLSTSAQRVEVLPMAPVEPE